MSKDYRKRFKNRTALKMATAKPEPAPSVRVGAGFGNCGFGPNAPGPPVRPLDVVLVMTIPAILKRRAKRLPEDRPAAHSADFRRAHHRAERPRRQIETAAINPILHVERGRHDVQRMAADCRGSVRGTR